MPNNMKKLLCAFFVLCASVCMGQQGLKFRNENYVGVTSGQLGGYGSVQTVNGVYKGPWFVGLGAATDYYEYRSVPLFVSVQRDLIPGGNGGAKNGGSSGGDGTTRIGGGSGFFVRLDGGVDVPWYKRGP